MITKTRVTTATLLAARALLGALLFLVFASYLALPCMVRDASQFQAAGAANSCSEHHLFRPQADLSTLFKSMNFETTYRVPLMSVMAVVPVLLMLRLLPSNHERLKRRRRRRAQSLPFATENPPRLPMFAALRDA